MDFLTRLIQILQDIADLSFNEARELAEEIVQLFEVFGGDNGSNSLDIQQIQQVVQAIENQSIQVVSSRIVQSQQIISSQLNSVQQNIINYISRNIVASNSQIVALLNQVRGDIALNTEILRNQIAISQNNILSQIAQLPSIIQRQINQSAQIIINRLDMTTSQISQAILADIRSEQEMSILLNRTLLQLFANLSNNMSDSFYIKFRDILDRSDETSLEDLIPQLQDAMKDALIDSFDSDEFKRAIHPQENNIMEFIRTVFSGVDATTSAIGEIIDFSSDTGSLIMRLIQLLTPDTLINMAIQMAAEPFLRHIYHKSSRVARSDLLSVEQLLSFYLQDRSRLGFVQNYMRTIGYSEDDINILMTQVNRPLREETIQQLFYRNDISGVDAVHYLRQLGYTDEGQNEIRKLWDLIPPIQDIIRMAVRDVFNPSAVQEFGLDENQPQEFIDWAKKQGLSDFWASKYWQAHWALPSMTQGYEMFQRQIITIEQLKQLMQALDIPPKWRDYLIEMNYSPITRVDVRRMHDMGFLTFDEMVKRYRDVGYSPEDANLLGLWTEEYNSRGSDGQAEQTKELTRAVIVQGYTVGLLSQEQAVTQLQGIGYSAENAQYLLQLSELQRNIDAIPDRLKDNYRRMETIISKGFITGTLSETEVRQGFQRIGFSEDDINSEITFLNIERETQINGLLIDLIRKQFVQYQLTEDRTVSILSGYGFNQNEIQSLMSQWTILRLYRSDLPAKTEIKKFLEQGLIDINTAENFLRGLGYPDSTVNLYTRSWSM